MGLKAGIVGLPNVGKSTLFNAITNSKVEAANYPFATINPNIGVVNVPDSRVDFLSESFKPKRTIYTTFEFFDIAGLVKGASKGEGLGNKFLANIRECDAIIQVIRCFENNEIIHVENSIDPIRDADIINLELALSDLDTCVNRIGKIENKARIQKDKESIGEYNLLIKVKKCLESELPLRSLSLNEDEEKIIKNFSFLTRKPMMYVANISDSDIKNPSSNEHYVKLLEMAEKENIKVIPVSCEIEAELSQYSKEEKEEFLKEIGAESSGLDLLIKSSYDLLNLSTFFTVGTDEVRAWTFKKGMLAPDCAGIIHTDFKKGFIRAETYNFNDFKEYKSEQALKDNGKIRIEGKDYVAQDGDIFFFRFNV